MIYRYKKAIEFCAGMLFLIRRNDENLGAVLSYQLYILEKIKQCERNILRKKRENLKLTHTLKTERPSKEEARKIKAKLKRYKEAIDDYHQLIYIWKSFGDSLVFHYCDKYAIKHLLYDENYIEKRPPGFITGKLGAKYELEVLKKFFEDGIPAVLSDTTNSLRNGDVCLLGMRDPFPVEVKSSGRIDERGEKQLANLHKITDFFKTDTAENFRNQGGTTKRIALHKPEKNYESELNSTIARSYKEQTAIFSPEKGIHYIVITGKMSEDAFKHVGKYVHVVYLNERKSNGTWHPYNPYTSSLEPQHIYNFIFGTTSIIVVLDLQEIKRQFFAAGIKIAFFASGPYYAQITVGDEMKKGVWRISQQSFERIAFEFQSLEWFINEQVYRFNNFEEAEGVDTDSIPPDWKSFNDNIPL